MNKETIEQIAKLARLKLTENETEKFTEQITKSIEYFNQISEINTNNVEPLLTPTEIEFFSREDMITKEATTEELLKNAPEKVGNLFKVPPVV